MQKIPLDYLVETIAKALCFEKYVAINEIEDFESVDLEAASDYYEERADQYLNKSYELLNMFHDFNNEEMSDTVH